MAGMKKCPGCLFSIPSEAVVCGHCGSRIIAYMDNSVFGRIVAAVKGGVSGAFLAGLVGIFAGDAFTWATWGGLILGGLGLLVGNRRERIA